MFFPPKIVHYWSSYYEDSIQTMLIPRTALGYSQNTTWMVSTGVLQHGSCGSRTRDMTVSTYTWITVQLWVTNFKKDIQAHNKGPKWKHEKSSWRNREYTKKKGLRKPWWLFQGSQGVSERRLSYTIYRSREQNHDNYLSFLFSSELFPKLKTRKWYYSN